MVSEGIIKTFRDILGEENVKVNEPMKNHTSFKVGGPADVLVTPDNVENLKYILDTCKSQGIPYFIMGNGTNLVVRDKGMRGVVIKIFENFKNCSVDGEVIEAEAGILLSRLANVALENELQGLEFASGIPGTLGGAVAMNAGAYDGEMKDVIVETEFIDSEGQFVKIKGDQHQFGYRTSFIQKSGGIVLKTVLKLKKGNKENIKAYMDDLKKRRKDKQPIEMPSAGSVFKRPEGYFTGKLIDDCGLKGCSIGGAQVSPKHSGFIVNTGDASCNDIIALIEKIKYDVKLKFGVDLNTEVRIVGEE